MKVAVRARLLILCNILQFVFVKDSYAFDTINQIFTEETTSLNSFIESNFEDSESSTIEIPSSNNEYIPELTKLNVPTRELANDKITEIKEKTSSNIEDSIVEVESATEHSIKNEIDGHDSNTQKNQSEKHLNERNFMPRVGLADASRNNHNPFVFPDKVAIPKSESSDILNLDDFSRAALDAWKPVWPFPKQVSISIKPTIRFPSISIPNVKVQSTVRPIQENTVPKEPVTAYYFDLSSSAPLPVSGPLHDPADVVADRFPTANNVQDLSLLESSINDRVHSERLPIAIEPTPVFRFPTAVRTKPSSVIQSHNATLRSQTITESVTPVNVVEDLVSSIFEWTSPRIISTTASYSLGNSSDFQFDTTDSSKDFVKTNNSTLLSSTLSPGVEITETITHTDQPVVHTDTNNFDYEERNSELGHQDVIEVIPLILEVDHNDSTTSRPTTARTSISAERVNGTTSLPIVNVATNRSTIVPMFKNNISELTDDKISFSTTEVPKISSSKKPIVFPAKTTTQKIIETTFRTTSLPKEEERLVAVVEELTGFEPNLHIVKMHHNGTNSTHPSPFVKMAVSYDIREFCHHKNNIHALLREWINVHLANATMAKPYEIEVFYQPDCKNIYVIEDNDETTTENRTNLYFYVKQNGKIDPNVTILYPKNPTALEISQELNYLKRKILYLELVNAVPTQENLLIEEAAVGTSIIVIVIVSTLLLVLLVASTLAFFVVKKRKAADTMHGRRCTPANDAYSLDSVSMFYHSIRRKSRKRASNKSLKSYLNHGFDDPNGPSYPLTFVKLTAHISDNEGIYEEFTKIPSILAKYDEMPRGVEDKNRYANVIPVSETRILLNNTTPYTEYINANSIHGPKGELRYYIATQAPLEETLPDFWQMIWEQESKVIVMLTDFVEKGIEKCTDYLPPSETLDCHRVYGEYQITLKSRDIREKYVVSVIQIKNLENNLTREIVHMWFTGWPYSGVPREEKIFISFIFDVRTTRKQLRAKGPIVVHCSPGTGRTGTYIACDLVMKQFDEQKVVDIPKTVYRIRRERAGAVQTRDQYAFIYRVVNMYAAKLTTGNLDSF